MTALFEDLYRARIRLSVYEFDQVLSQVEALPPPRTQPMLLLQLTLRSFVDEALTVMESRQAELRQRLAALPALPKVQSRESEEVG